MDPGCPLTASMHVQLQPQFPYFVAASLLLSVCPTLPLCDDTQPGRGGLQSEEGENQDRILGAAVVLFISLFKVVFLLTLLLFSLGWGFIRQSLRSKEGWLVSRVRIGIGQ